MVFWGGGCESHSVDMSFAYTFPRILLGLVLATASALAYANAFIPTMISANVLWALILPVVVFVEGRLMARWEWNNPYKTALRGNLLSMLAALPFGILLSLTGHYLTTSDAKTTLSVLSAPVRFFLAQAFFYGEPDGPSYGYIVGFSFANILLAALIFIGLCWLVTFVVEGHYYSKKNPLRTKREIFRRTALANVASYCILILLWLPYSYYAAHAWQGDEYERTFCGRAWSWSSRCIAVWEKWPGVKERRLAECNRLGISNNQCLERSN